MTNKEAIDYNNNLKEYMKITDKTSEYKFLQENYEALDMANKALEQQPTDEKTYLKRREENYVEYNVEWFLKNWELELEILSGGKIKPTDEDCISRSYIESIVEELENICINGDEHILSLLSNIKNAPSVTPSFNSIETELKPSSGDCISREQALQVIEKEKQGWGLGETRYAIDECHTRVAELPSVTPQPKIGHWITTRTPMHLGEFYCDKCKCYSPNNIKWDWCPTCGAKMEVSK